jgi:hypothetical protein
LRRGWARGGAVALLLSGAFGGSDARSAPGGRYRVDFRQMRAAVDSMAGVILRYQGDGDYQGDLDRLATEGIPVDVVFEQGVDVMTAAR